MNSKHKYYNRCGISLGVVLAALLLGACDKREENLQPDRLDKVATEADEDRGAGQTAAGDEQPYPSTEAPPPDTVRGSDAMNQYNTPASGSQATAVVQATANLEPTANQEANGQINFATDPHSGQMAIHVNLSGLTPGRHGMHIHQNGDCSAGDASSAGGHFNPTGARHGGHQDIERHLGDLGNIEADDQGNVDTTVYISGLSFSGSTSIIQKAIIVHTEEDDLKTDPSGNSGDPVACGVIQQS